MRSLFDAGALAGATRNSGAWSSADAGSSLRIRLGSSSLGSDRELEELLSEVDQLRVGMGTVEFHDVGQRVGAVARPRAEVGTEFVAIRSELPPELSQMRCDIWVQLLPVLDFQGENNELGSSRRSSASIKPIDSSHRPSTSSSAATSP